MALWFWQLFLEAQSRASFLSPYNDSVSFLFSLINFLARTDTVACNQGSSLTPLDSLTLGLVDFFKSKLKLQEVKRFVKVIQ